jgi:hypothetical protein
MQEDLEGVSFGDKRLDIRFKKIMEKCFNNPRTSIPNLFQTWGETQAVYRFFDNDKVTPEKMLEPHYKQTTARISEHKTVLLVQDTSALMYQMRDDIEGMGVVSSDDQQGFMIHPTIAVTPERLCLGITHLHYWNRKEIKKKTHDQKAIDAKRTIEEKESVRWLESLVRSEAIAESCMDTRLVVVGDRENDIFEVLNYKGSVKFLTRVSHDRVTKEGYITADTMNTEPIGSCEFFYHEEKRMVKQDIYVKNVCIRDPKKHNVFTDSITIIICLESNPPEGQDPISWSLATSVELDETTKAEDVINWYLCRWEIELLFKVLKSGFEVEKKQFRNFDRTIRSTTLYLLTAWRILFLTRIGEVCPDISCDIVFHEYEWKLLYYSIHKKPPPSIPPKLGVVINYLAQLGGYLNRKHDPKPGAKVLWQGVNKLFYLVEGWLMAKDFPHKT